MEEKFARENEALRQELSKGVKGGSAAQQGQLKQMDKRKKAIDSFRSKAKVHVNEYKRELYSLEDQLKRVVPLVAEANQMATQLGRCVSFEARLVVHIPESLVDDPLSPVEELLTQKQIELLVKCALHNPRTDMKREWFWPPEVFYNKIGDMRKAWQKWMLEQIMIPLHSGDDPFWSPPAPQLIGSAYLYLAPVAYCCPAKQWVPIYDYAGTKQGELSVVLKPTKPDGKSPLPPTNDPESLAGKPLNFELTIESARGLMECPNKNVRIEYTFSDEEGKRTTPTCQGKKFDPKFSEKHAFAIPKVEDRHIAYLCKDAICFEIWGESEDVEEGDVAEAISMELPPETFEFFLSHDFMISDSHDQCTFDMNLVDKKQVPSGGTTAGHILAQDTAFHLDFSIAQSDKHFKVADVGRVQIGNWRDPSGKAVKGATWAALRVTKQNRASDSAPWVVTCDLPNLPGVMNQAEHAGKVFLCDLKAEVQEIERLGLDEGLQLIKTLSIKIVAKGEGKSAKYSDKERTTRDRATTVTCEVYMGQFEVSDAAVNLAMMNLRDESQGDTKSILTNHEDEVEKIKNLLVEENARQFEDLALKAEPLGFDLGPSLALWTLPSEIIGGLEMGTDKESLQKMVVQLKNELKAAKERIAYLESSTAASKAQRQIKELRYQIANKNGSGAGAGSKANKNGSGAGAGSKACIIS